jgi:mxaA protein
MTRWPLVIAAVALAACSAAHSGVTPATVKQPRAFGYVLGDVLTQRVQIGQEEPLSVLPTGRVGPWFDRHPPRVETDAAGMRWWVIDYQLVNAPRSLIAVRLPALMFKARSGSDCQVAEWPVSIGPLTPDSVAEQGDLNALRPDREVGERLTAPLLQRLVRWLGAFVLTLSAWLAWWCWRNRRERVRLPFARAWHTLRRMDNKAVQSDPDAWRCLHQALNDTAGRVVQPAALSVLLLRAPHLQVLQSRLEHFYQSSNERFFAAVPKDEPYPLRELCLALRDAEKRHYAGH